MPEDIQNNNVFGNPNVVIALLDWGLGHTTRSIPIIRVLNEMGCTVTIACNSSQKALLISEFPSLRFLPLNGYNLRYSNSSWLTRLAIAFQAPKILTIINKERKWLHAYAQSHKIDLIISDNRYGFHHREIPSIIITHQLAIKTGIGRLTDLLVNRFVRKWIERFSACWVPDSKNEPWLAGELSHPSFPPSIQTIYLGPLSRLKPCRLPKQQFILIVLSGPEPQRSILEEILTQQASRLTQEFVLVRGIADATRSFSTSASNIRIHDRLPSAELNHLLCAADLVISRAGYTSIMDYSKLGVKSVLIPTPGQAEQEYLARYLADQHFAITCEQEKVKLGELIEEAQHFDFRNIQTDMELYKQEIVSFMKNLPLRQQVSAKKSLSKEL